MREVSESRRSEAGRAPFALLLFALGATSVPPAVWLAGEGGAPAALEKPAPNPDVLRRGAALFQRDCAACHGATGRGDGPAAYLLGPPARDFSTGRFRVVGTDNGVPSDDDLFSVLTRGMPGSAMPPWGHLAANDRWALVYEVRRLATVGLEERMSPFVADGSMTSDEARDLAVEKMLAGEAVTPPPPPAESDEGLFLGRRLYASNCASCHGASGRGDGAAEQRDENGYPVRPRDLTRGIFKGPSAPAELWKRIRNGMPGSPMPAAATLDDQSVWRLVQYVSSLVPPLAEGRILQTRQEIVAVRTPEALPADPVSREWARSKPVYVALAPLFWRDERPEGVLVEALHDGSDIAFRLTWEDATRSDSVVGMREFSDAAAIQFALGPDEPLFAMGDASSPVAIWYWRAAWDRDRGGTPADVESAYPGMAVDTYPSLARPHEPGVPLEVAERARAADFSPEFLTGAGAGNPVSRLVRGHAGEAAVARGFGTLASANVAPQGFTAAGSYGGSGDPSWSVVFRRSLAGLAAPAVEVSLTAGGRGALAFAVWDGGAQDRAGQKSFSIWHDLVVEP